MSPFSYAKELVKGSLSNASQSTGTFIRTSAELAKLPPSAINEYLTNLPGQITVERQVETLAKALAQTARSVSDDSTPLESMRYLQVATKSKGTNISISVANSPRIQFNLADVPNGGSVKWTTMTNSGEVSATGEFQLGANGIELGEDEKSQKALREFASAMTTLTHPFIPTLDPGDIYNVNNTGCTSSDLRAIDRAVKCHRNGASKITNRFFKDTAQVGLRTGLLDETQRRNIANAIEQESQLLYCQPAEYPRLVAEIQAETNEPPIVVFARTINDLSKNSIDRVANYGDVQRETFIANFSQAFIESLTDTNDKKIVFEDAAHDSVVKQALRKVDAWFKNDQERAAYHLMVSSISTTSNVLENSMQNVEKNLAPLASSQAFRTLVEHSKVTQALQNDEAVMQQNLEEARMNAIKERLGQLGLAKNELTQILNDSDRAIRTVARAEGEAQANAEYWLATPQNNGRTRWDSLRCVSNGLLTNHQDILSDEAKNAFTKIVQEYPQKSEDFGALIANDLTGTHNEFLSSVAQATVLLTKKYKLSFEAVYQEGRQAFDEALNNAAISAPAAQAENAAIQTEAVVVQKGSQNNEPPQTDAPMPTEKDLEGDTSTGEFHVSGYSGEPPSERTSSLYESRPQPVEVAQTAQPQGSRPHP